MKRTPSTSLLSPATALTGVTFRTDAPAPGQVTVTVGGVVSGGAGAPVTSKASTTTYESTADGFFVPVDSAIKVCEPEASPVAENITACSCSVAAYASTVATCVPSSRTLAIPANGPRKPIQLIAVPLNVKVARATVPVSAAIAAVPPLHGRDWLPCAQV